MKQRFIVLLSLVVGSVALADILLEQADVKIGPISYLSCRSDGGLLCWRDAGSVGEMQCNSASSTETGCVTPSAQSWAGNKTFSGNVKTPIIDAGVGAIGSIDVRASTITGTQINSTLTLQSNTTDATTSSSVAAMTFQLGANITDSDLGWAFKDSAGITRLSCTEGGTVNFSTHVTDTATSFVVGTPFTSTLGNGFAASGGSVGTGGGAYTFTAGTGGAADNAAAAGQGGTVTVTAGAGGVASTSFVAGAGGAITITSGAGGNNATGINGGAGGAMTVRAGAGKAGSSGGGTALFAAGAGGNASTSVTSSVGGAVTVNGGAGGNANATKGDPGSAGGAITIQSGQGGAEAAGPTLAGAGGVLTLKSGNGGTSVSSGGASGDVTLDTGAATGSSTNGVMSIGATNANSITIGRTGKGISAPGTLTVTGAVIAIGGLSTQGNFSVGASGTSMSDSRTCTFTVNPGLIAANTCANVTSGTCTGASTGDPVACAPVATVEDGLVPSCWISAANTGKVRLCNVTTGGITPASATYGLRFFH